ncbi:CHD5-like protein [Popillia japonica]|uniref:Guided entry of tail-anchored proteins factor 1 n=1 Tax=Popillia japonica TaxID=7064 RepID=A0AAW1NKK7_POPJA
MYIDVFLLTVIFVLCVINTKISYFTKPILKWLYQASTQEKELLVEKVKLKNEQAQISMVDNFARHAKIQRKINAIDEEMSQMKSDRQTNHLLTRLFFQFIMKC